MELLLVNWANQTHVTHMLKLGEWVSQMLFSMFVPHKNQTFDMGIKEKQNRDILALLQGAPFSVY